MNIDILEAVPAAGKTAAILEFVAESEQPAIIASISRQLSRQSYEYYLKIGGEGATIVDTDNKIEYSSVCKTIEKHLTENKPRVLFITHAALTQFESFELFKGYHLYIDEVPDMVSLEMMRFTYNSYKILQYCEPIDGEVGITYNLALNEECREELTKIAIDGFFKNDEIAEKLLPIYRSLLHGFPVKIRWNDDGVSQVFFIEDLTNLKWEVFSGITIACANFYKTFTGYVLKHWNSWKFNKSHLHERLKFDKYPNTRRVQINVMVDQNWSRYVADKTIDGSNVYNVIQDTVENMFPGSKYIYTTNSYRTRMNGHQIQYNPHGLNMYSDESNIVALFSYNPQPWQIPILNELAVMQNLNENELIDAFIVSKYLEPIFQLCTRGDIRNVKSTKMISLIVPDVRAADYLKENYMPDAYIDYGNMTTIEKKLKVGKEFNWKTRGITTILEMTDKERTAFYYFCKKNDKKANKMDPSDPANMMFAKDWLTKYREKKSKKK